MPPRSVTIDIRDAAQAKIKASAAVLSERFGVAFPAPAGFEGRDWDYLRARELESIAGFLEALANEPGSDETKTLKVKLAQAETQLANLTEEAVLLRAEIESLTAAWQEAETKLAAAGLPTSADAVPELPPIVEVTHGAVTIDFDPVTITLTDGELSLSDTAGLVAEPEPDAAPVDLSRMNRASLNEYAVSLGIADVESFATKAELIAAIEALPK